MVWEWEDGEEAGRQSDEVPVDFDFISLLSKPKVKPNCQLPPPLGFIPSNCFFIGRAGRIPAA
jgi:hypothetical protein